MAFFDEKGRRLIIDTHEKMEDSVRNYKNKRRRR
jgi:hypothetical protein